MLARLSASRPSIIVKQLRGSRLHWQFSHLPPAATSTLLLSKGLARGDRHSYKERGGWLGARATKEKGERVLLTPNLFVCLLFCLPAQVRAISLEVCPRCGHACLLPLGLKGLEQNCVWQPLTFGNINNINMEFQGTEVMCGDRSGGINKDAACSREAQTAPKTRAANNLSNVSNSSYGRGCTRLSH